MQKTQRQLTKNEKKIIEIGRANDKLNKYAIKISLPPVIIAVVLILLYGFIWSEPVIMVVGLGFLLIGCLYFIVVHSYVYSCARFRARAHYAQYRAKIEKKTEK